MKNRVLTVSLIAVAMGTGVAYQLLYKAPRPRVAENMPEQLSRRTETERGAGSPEQDAHHGPLPSPQPPPMEKGEINPEEMTTAATRKQPDRHPQKRPDPSRYWEVQAQRFNGLLEQLAREQDPDRRIALIRKLAAYVRIDTLGTLDWAMSLQNQNERRAALEAISKSSLSGIGARIEIDETGFPKIRETSVLSAIAETGLVAPGDYIVGMVDQNGQAVSFENLSIQQVVKYLRGQPGSEVKLLMERMPSNRNGEPQTFDVSVQRSLLVIEPPY